MKRRLIILTLTALVVMAFIGVTLTVASPVHAGGATQISGIGYFDVGGDCSYDDVTVPDHAIDTFALTLEGDLEGCHYVFVETAECSPSGTYRETGTELFVGDSHVDGQEGSGTFRTTYRFTAKYADCANLVGEIFGRCQHPIIAGSGTEVFGGVTGRLDFKDDIEAGNFPYRGHLRW